MLASSLFDLPDNHILPGSGFLARRFSFDRDKQAIVANQIIKRARAVAERHAHEHVTLGVTSEYVFYNIFDPSFQSGHVTNASCAIHSSLGKIESGSVKHKTSLPSAGCTSTSTQ